MDPREKEKDVNICFPQIVCLCSLFKRNSTVSQKKMKERGMKINGRYHSGRRWVLCGFSLSERRINEADPSQNVLSIFGFGGKHVGYLGAVSPPQSLWINVAAVLVFPRINDTFDGSLFHQWINGSNERRFRCVWFFTLNPLDLD